MDRSESRICTPLSCAAYCKRITFGLVFCLVPFAVDILPVNQVHRQLCIYKGVIKWIKNAKSNPQQIAENTAKYRTR